MNLQTLECLSSLSMVKIMNRLDIGAKDNGSLLTTTFYMALEESSIRIQALYMLGNLIILGNDKGFIPPLNDVTLCTTMAFVE